jgi:hypothetical protein
MAFYPIRCLAKSCNRTARTGEGDIAEHGAKDDRVLSFAAQVTTAGRTAAVPIDEGGSLSGDDMLLQALLQGFALADRQANGFELVVALLEMQDLAVGDYGAIVADDPKLKVNVHGRRHAFRKLQGIQPPNYLPSPAQATNLPRFLLLSAFRTHCLFAQHGGLLPTTAESVIFLWANCAPPVTASAATYREGGGNGGFGGARSPPASTGQARDEMSQHADEGCRTGKMPML